MRRGAPIALSVALVVTGCRNRSLKVGAGEPAASPDATPGPGPATSPAPAAPGALVAFPGAEGFGRSTTGGRGGKPCLVTTLAKEGAGSLRECLEKREPRTVVFRVSGVIEGPIEIPYGRLTIAGQSSPGGIVVRGGLVCDNVYDKNDCNDVVIRHVRLRDGAPDSLRLGGARNVIVDHASLTSADDENLEITRSHDVTIQYSIIAEPRGEHYTWGGVLLNYSKDVMPLDAITLHHDVWNGVAGRLPEISCEENDDGPGKSNCSGHVLRIALVDNVMFDAHDPVWFNRCTNTNGGNDCPEGPQNLKVQANVVGNVLYRRLREDGSAPFVEPSFFGAQNQVFFAENKVVRGLAVENVAPPRSLPAPHAFPPLTRTPPAALAALLAREAGAKPHDSMDARLASYLSNPVDSRPPAWKNGKGVVVGDALAPRPSPPPPVDTDQDGMPDVWEKAHGLDPTSPADHASSKLGETANNGVAGCTPGYTALECFLNELAAR